ncbi:ABC transporter ATP-binding protein [Propionimicrobium sp. PCR01-08-3]|uniref:ABC transporter ATP-binding protein n=1 Tax=Propionimicrobium sp. PCR01-08-3 TaxID=3052086 RepID=UPI00255CA54A|nr:ABC transporter ATP-binding protein [Propionimicrobium sp. PCR01-08-3]WIY82912.1 ABC transporter ATP-binding protein [Propionimicrobium sp. PCR01-08-3]
MAKTKQQPDLRPAVNTRDEGTAWHARVEAGEHILEVDDLTISATATGNAVVKNVDLDLMAGEILALVGESGSGKTTVGLALLGHIRRGLEHSGGTVNLYASHSDQPVEMMTLDEASRRELRGARVSYIPQDPALSLNPGIRVGRQIREVLDIHGYGASDADRADRVRSVLREVGLPDDDTYQRRWPHQLSGGQQQRIGIAMAFAMYPDVIVLDEPTTGLDVTTQEQVLETIREMTVKHNAAGLYITHDLAVVSEIADRVAVMLRGQIVEVGDAAQILHHPQHDYTKRLLAAVPDLAGRNQLGSVAKIDEQTSAFITGEVDAVTDETMADEIAELAASDGVTAKPDMSATSSSPEEPSIALTVRDLNVSYGNNQVLRGVGLKVDEGQCTLLLGESGSGKTTLARAIAGILDADFTGVIEYEGEQLAISTRDRTLEQRKKIQYIFQSPFSSLNPRRTLGQSLVVPLEMAGDLDAHGRHERVRDALDAVRLGRQFYDRRPGDLSGGERQRAAIARALVDMPSVLVCDEITSALDVSVQASIISLLHTIQEELGLSMLFVTHNIALARHIASRVAVLNRGVIVEEGPVDSVLDHPQHDYTQELLTNVPAL